MTVTTTGAEKDAIVTENCKIPLHAFQLVGINERNGIPYYRGMLYRKESKVFIKSYKRI